MRSGDTPIRGEDLAEVSLLTKAEVEALHPDDQAKLAWDGAAHGGQRPPAGGWRTWVFLGGRGAGKTRAGAEWVSDVAAKLGAGGRIALVGATLHDVRAVMVEGPSGLMSLPYRTPPRMESSLRRLVFPGGAVGVMLSAAEPERLRGPQFHAAWGDEFCAWERAEEVLAMLRLGVRLGLSARRPLRHGPEEGRATSPREGEDCRAQAARDRVASDSPQEWTPRLLLTTTPKPLAVLRRVLAEEGCVRTHAPTGANAGNLAEGFLEAMQDLYGGTRRAAQELDGVVLEAEGALFTHVEMARARALGRSWMLGGAREGYERAVVAVDPPVGTLSGEGGDACGIVVVARAAGTAWVLDDRSVRGLSPAGWAARVARTAKDWEAALGCPVRVVAEGNQGGDMVEAVLKGAGVTQVVKRVQARVGKRARAEPVAALYEQGRVGHVGELTMLEEELLGLGEAGGASPDRADALVWAVTDLLIDGGGGVMPRAWAL
ncbi:terminase large subunit domain-containing protein [Brevundimonas sp.]|uniref:terminase large subunit domain-containing protein n=1 Tax=Brevundimonas sp. TaxID=1871086 RepID=UPI00286D600A|nr:terminase family protein [Brevundimonas sp.]